MLYLVAEIQSTCSDIEKINEKFIQFMCNKYKICGKKKSIPEINYENFMKLLEINKVKISFEEEANWVEYINGLNTKAKDFHAKITQLKNKIDANVFKLYELSEDEINVVQKLA